MLDYICVCVYVCVHPPSHLFLHRPFLIQNFIRNRASFSQLEHLTLFFQESSTTNELREQKSELAYFVPPSTQVAHEPTIRSETIHDDDDDDENVDESDTHVTESTTLCDIKSNDQIIESIPIQVFLSIEVFRSNINSNRFDIFPI